MRYAWLACLFVGKLLSAGTQDSEFNVNTRYMVETVMVSGDGWSTDVVSDHDSKLSSGLRKEIAALVGQKLNPSALDDLSKRIRKELHARTVEHHVLRGKSPDYVQVVFEVKLRPTEFDLSVPKFLYQSKQGWSGAIEGTATIKHNGFTAGLHFAKTDKCKIRGFSREFAGLRNIKTCQIAARSAIILGRRPRSPVSPRLALFVALCQT